LAGRGTDIKADSIEKYGGLHVIITFFPKNLRVEDQAKGRTARNGSSGSCQIILNKMQLSFEYSQENNYL
jgi:preprotein translocase subunit SecA